MLTRDTPYTSTTVASSDSDEDDKELEMLGYVPSFKREFSNLATVSSYLFLKSSTSSLHASRSRLLSQ
jgi:hypothetical protein